MRKYFSLFLVPFLLGSCNWLEFPAFVLFGKTHERVKAEYTDLKGKRVAIIIAGLPAIDFEDPYARMDIALLSAELIRQEVDEVQFVDRNPLRGGSNPLYRVDAVHDGGAGEHQSRAGADMVPGEYL